MSQRPDHDVDNVRDYLVLCSYRRDALKGPLWEGTQNPAAVMPAPSNSEYRIADKYALENRPRKVRDGRLVSLDTDLPAKICAMKDLMSGEPVVSALTDRQKLSALTKLSAGALRWEPLNERAQHRGIPSPRSLYNAELRIAIPSACGNDEMVYRYLPDHHALEEVARNSPSIVSNGTLAFAIVGQMARSVYPYGEFCLSIVLPEAGLLSAQLGVLCKALGWVGRTRASIDAKTVGKGLGLSHWGEIPLAVVETDAIPDFGMDEATPALISDIELQASLLDLYPFLRRVVSDTVSDRVPGSDQRAPACRNCSPAPPAVPNADDIVDVVWRRNSGAGVGALVSAGKNFGRDALMDILMDWRCLYWANAESELKDIGLSTYLSLLAEGQDGGLYSFDLGTGTITQRSVENLAAHFSRNTGVTVNYREVCLVASITADFPDLFRSFGPRAYFLAQQAAGEIAQPLALACARANLFLRPIRAYSEREIDASLSLDDYTVLQLVAGYNRTANPAFPLG
jgi:hypothetical protein